MYQKGDGVTKDMAKAGKSPGNLVKAAQYYKYGVERGDLLSANEYGLLFADGPGRKDYVEAYGWLSYVAKSGSKATAQDLAQLERLLGDKIGEAETRARAIEKLIRENRLAMP